MASHVIRWLGQRMSMGAVSDDSLFWHNSVAGCFGVVKSAPNVSSRVNTASAPKRSTTALRPHDIVAAPAPCALPLTVQERTFRQACSMLRVKTQQYIQRQDELVAQCGSWAQFWRECIRILSIICGHGIGYDDLYHLLSSDGQICCSMRTRTQVRAFKARSADLADTLIRSYTVHHNHDVQGHPRLPSQTGADSTPAAANAAARAITAKTPFIRAAERFVVPTLEDVEAAMPKGRQLSDHAAEAARRHLTVTRIRAMIESTGAISYDTSVSSSRRDDSAFGVRPVNSLKDLGHQSRPIPDDQDRPLVYTLIDCLCYEGPDGLAPYSGSNIAIWAPCYPNLAGQAENSNYYAEDERVFVECVGGKKPGAVYKRQIPWNLTGNDMTYIENEDRSAFTVYRIIRHPQPGTLKQVVFLGAVQTVNLPYAVVDDITLWSKGHRLGDTGIKPLGPCDNVKLIPRDTKRPWTKDILIMANGTSDAPTVSVKYKDDKGPRSSVTMSEGVYGLLHYTHHCSARGQTITEITTKLRYYKDADTELYLASVACYAELLRSAPYFGPLPNVVYYDAASPDEVPVEVHSAQATLAMPPITSGTNPGVLAKTDEAMKVYVEEKMEGAKNTTTPTSDWVKISDLNLRNFITCVGVESGIEPNSLYLKDFAEVEATRTKAIQKARADTYGAGPDEEQLGMVNLKVEGQHKVKQNGPRGITMQSYRRGVESGMLGKLLTSLVEGCSWYLPGRTPTAIAEAVAACYKTGLHHEQLTLDRYGDTLGSYSIDADGNSPKAGTVRNVHGIREIDYVTADEKHCEHSNRILRAMITHFVAKEDVDRALRIYEECFHMEVRIGKKTKSSEWKNSSGTGITTVLNTIVFAERELETTCVALVFAAMIDSGNPNARLTNKTFHEYMNIVQKSPHYACFPDHGRMIHMAYNWIGPKFGDDQLDPSTPFVRTDIWERAMCYVDMADGFDRTFAVRSCVEGEPTEMLSRVYPNPLASLCSYCKVEKALDKLTLAVGGDLNKYIMKCRGYWTTDRNTPVVGAYLEAAAAMYKFKLSAIDHNDEATMAALYDSDRDLYFKTVNGPFPWEEGAYELCLESFCVEYDTTSGEMQDFIDTLRLQSTWDGIQECWLPAKPGCIPTLPNLDPLNVTRVAHRSGAVRLCDLPCKMEPVPEEPDDGAGALTAPAGPSPAPPYRDPDKAPTYCPPQWRKPATAPLRIVERLADCAVAGTSAEEVGPLGAFTTAQTIVHKSALEAAVTIASLQKDLASIQELRDTVDERDAATLAKVHCDALRMQQHREVQIYLAAAQRERAGNSAESAPGDVDDTPESAVAVTGY